MPTPHTPSARHLAAQLLARWTTFDNPPPIPERSREQSPWNNLPPRDRAFAFDLITGIFRWRKTLDHILASLLRPPATLQGGGLEPNLHAILLLGAYQLLLHTGTTPYAAIDTSVDLAKTNPLTAKAAGLVNAVLRNLTRLQPTRQPYTQTLSPQTFAIDFSTQITFAKPLFPNPETHLASHLAITRSHPEPYVAHLLTLFNPTQTAGLLLRDNLRPHITLRSDTATLNAPAAAGLVPHPDSPRFLIANAGWNNHLDTLIHTGKLSPQDPTSAKPIQRYAELVASKKLPKPKQILDLCAGLGTKSLQLARTFPDAHITATDIDESKLRRLLSRVSEVRQPNLSTVALNSLQNKHLKFDLILVDAPCSNTGVLAKRVQSRWRWPTLDHPALHTLQKSLLTQAQSLLTPTGAIIYATCSIDPAENTAISKISPLKLLEETTTLPSTGPSAQISPHDGGYFAILTP